MSISYLTKLQAYLIPLWPKPSLFTFITYPLCQNKMQYFNHLAPILRDSDSVRLMWSQVFAILTIPQVMPLLLTLGPSIATALLTSSGLYSTAPTCYNFNWGHFMYQPTPEKCWKPSRMHVHMWPEVSVSHKCRGLFM